MMVTMTMKMTMTKMEPAKEILKLE